VTVTAASRIAAVTFDGHTITINRPKSGFVDRGTRTIPIAQVTAVQFKPAGMMTGGYIRFVIPGTLEHRGHRTGALQTDVLKDENAVPFGGKQQAQFEALKDAVENAIAGRGPAGPAASVADELAKLHGLVRSGVLTSAEFEQAKAQLLGR
jgi:hypothetical protein